MDIIHSDFKKGIVKLKVTDADDLWYLSHLIDAGDFVSLDYDLSEILEVTPSMVNLDLISLGVDEDIAPDGDNEVSGSADSSDSSSSGSETGLASGNNSSNSNALINGDLIDSLVNHTEDLSLSFNDFI